MSLYAYMVQSIFKIFCFSDIGLSLPIFFFVYKQKLTIMSQIAACQKELAREASYLHGTMLSLFPPTNVVGSPRKV